MRGCRLHPGWVLREWNSVGGNVVGCGRGAGLQSKNWILVAGTGCGVGTESVGAVRSKAGGAAAAGRVVAAALNLTLLYVEPVVQDPQYQSTSD